ncbi:probable ATP-dependent RNA helicase DDX20 isoform X1 [Amyelois transitella]|uniref:probable ATP-dependent RNA helicase DDX20 isoform X1 n=1 Tax=Amyelois transitella TaxID=680683 RepID=UPI00298FEE80|nr:probable ATP-dependent RNA helicase DDX20 isoform X1 [Amyelois transitella]XP_060802408.1 probable ATP-dependent RNA helicase DDX20 isoform X1 [Amyelois transitella]XP_060802409.1 probable ATP-dependent RNA helicase DDX20 isoform X1 [Amyelois transitella]
MVLAHDINAIPRTRDVQISYNITFDNMLLAQETLNGLKKSGFFKPSPIQLHGIPLGKCGFDLLLEAKSGTGKTAVFSIIALEKIEPKKGLQVVILAPTREIAAQICDVIKLIGSDYKDLHVEVVMGGLPVQEDIEKFKKNVHIVVASPGRLRHLIQDKYIDTTSVRLLILDEADKLMEKSFQEDIKNIISFLPTQKQVIMSSATYDETAKMFIKSYVQNAQHVCPESNCVLLGVDQKVTEVKYNCNIVKQTQNRFQEVIKIFSKMSFKQCLIFCNYQARVSEIHKLLLRANWPAEQLSGNQEQTDRLEALKTLQQYKCRILIATDLAARGIDASNIDLVINFEPPFEWQTYLHRIGRAGRYGSYGMAVTILSEGVEAKKFHMMLDPMKDTINITNLWCNNNTFHEDISPKSPCPDVDKSCGTPQSNTQIEKACNELWKILVSDEEIIKNNKVESFENLCKSFDESSPGIETFHELLQSFENDDGHAEIDVSFKHIEINNDNFINIRAALKNNDLHSFEDNNKFTDKCEKLYYAHNNEKYDNYTEGNSNHNGKTFPNVINDHLNDYLVKNSENKENFIVSKDITTHSLQNSTEISDPHDPQRALLDAGLPTEFGKSNKKKTRKLYFNKKKPITSDIEFKILNDALEIERNVFCNGTGSNTKSKSVKTNDFKQSNTFIKNSETIKLNKSSHYMYKDYGDWYKHLKLQTKQIELAVYIDELSKL